MENSNSTFKSIFYSQISPNKGRYIFNNKIKMYLVKNDSCHTWYLYHLATVCIVDIINDKESIASSQYGQTSTYIALEYLAL